MTMLEMGNANIIISAHITCVSGWAMACSTAVLPSRLAIQERNPTCPSCPPSACLRHVMSLFKRFFRKKHDTRQLRLPVIESSSTRGLWLKHPWHKANKPKSSRQNNKMQ